MEHDETSRKTGSVQRVSLRDRFHGAMARASGKTDSKRGCEAHRAYSLALGAVLDCLSSGLDTEAFCAEVCEAIYRETGAVAAYVVSFDPITQEPRLVAASGPGAPLVRGIGLSTDPAQDNGHGFAGRIARGEGTLVEQDWRETPGDVPRAGQASLMTRFGIRSGVGVPLRLDGRAQGVLGVVSSVPHQFSPELVHLVEQMASAVSSGIAHARSRAQRGRYEAFFRALVEVGEVAVKDPTPEMLYADVARIIAGLPGELFAYVAVATPSSTELRVAAVAGATEALAEELKRTPLSTDPKNRTGRGITGTAFRNQATVAWGQAPEQAETAAKTRLARELGLKSIMGTPFFLDGECAGVLAIGSREPDYFQGEIVTLVERIGKSISLGLQAHQRGTSLRDQAFTDPLTGLPNRGLFNDRLAQELLRARRSGREVALALIDLDNFKDINDRLGHDAGDTVIRVVSARMRECLRPSDTIARLGGDELALILPTSDADAHIDEIMERVIAEVHRPLEAAGETIRMRASIGVATYPRDGASPEDLLRRADLAMYRIKNQGGDGWTVFEYRLESLILERHDLRERFTEALDQGAIGFHYQPEVNMVTGAVTGLEALARWRLPGGGENPAEEWISVIRQDDRLISKLGRLALGEALDRIRAWNRHGRDLSISVNIDHRYLRSPHFAADLQRLLAPNPALAAQLNIDVTEEALAARNEQIQAALRECVRCGANLVLDNFGRGDASLSYLKTLPTYALKVDRHFVEDIVHDIRAFGIVVGMVRATQVSDIRTLATGVATEEHGLRLIQIGCHHAQGAAIAMAMPPSKVPRWLDTWRAPESWVRARGRELAIDHMHLVSSLVFHRGRLRAITRLSLNHDERDEWNLRGLRRSACPLHVWLQESPRNSVSARQADVHARLHRIEAGIIEDLLAGDALEISEIRRLEQALRDYERAVEQLMGAFLLTA